MKTTIVAIFDNAVELDRGLTRLAEEGFNDVIAHDGIASNESSDEGLLRPNFEQSTTSEESGSGRKARKVSLSAIVNAFKTNLAEHHLSEDVIEGYAVNFVHEGKFGIVDTEPQKAQTAMKIMVECCATRVNRHG